MRQSLSKITGKKGSDFTPSDGNTVIKSILAQPNLLYALYASAPTPRRRRREMRQDPRGPQKRQPSFARPNAVTQFWRRRTATGCDNDDDAAEEEDEKKNVTLVLVKLDVTRDARTHFRTHFCAYTAQAQKKKKKKKNPKSDLRVIFLRF